MEGSDIRGIEAMLSDVHAKLENVKDLIRDARDEGNDELLMEALRILEEISE